MCMAYGTAITFLGYISDTFSLRSIGDGYMDGLCTYTQWSLWQWRAGRNLGQWITREEWMYSMTYWASINRKVKNKGSENLVRKVETMFRTNQGNNTRMRKNNIICVN